ncbi:MAG: alkaline phosphatase [Deltaproteobacteria bacterium]|nr:alkaline phosphatase [Deltaproteobacteria bacterium]
MDCPLLEVAFVGPEKLSVCMGESVPIRIEMTNGADDVTFVILATQGDLASVEGEDGVWSYVNFDVPGVVTFNLYVEASCGRSVETFELTIVDCMNSGVDSETSTEDTASPTDTGTDSDTADDTDTPGDSSSESRPFPPTISYDGPRHVILFIGDGMGQPCETALSRYIAGVDKALSFHEFPYANQVTTWDINTYNLHAWNADMPLYSPGSVAPTMGYDPALGGASILRGDDIAKAYFVDAISNWPNPDYSGSIDYAVTDSAAAATAMATGCKTDEGNLSWQSGDVEDGAITTIAEQAKRAGMKMGVVSTVPFSHATPAAFVSHNTYRGDYMNIAREIIFQTVPDVVISAGHPVFYGSYGFLSEAEYLWLQNTTMVSFAERKAKVNGTDTLMAAAEAAVIRQTPLFGLFGGQSFEHPEPVHQPASPSFTMSTMETPSLADVTRAATTVLANGDDGFFLMVEGGAIDWANHNHDYPRMLGTMWDFNSAVKAAVDWVNEEGDSVTMDNTLIIVTADHANGYITHSPTNPLGVGELPDASADEPRVSYGISGHTNELVSIYAIGAGIAGGPAPLFAPYEYLNYPEYPIIDNTHIYHVMAHFLGLDESKKAD